MANDSLQKKRDSKRWVGRVESLLFFLHQEGLYVQFNQPPLYPTESS